MKLQVSISLSPDKQTFVTGSVDKTSKLWDIRESSPKQTFLGHTADVNSVFVREFLLLLLFGIKIVELFAVLTLF